MSNDPKRPRQDGKSALPEFWSTGFYHRLVRTTIARELSAILKPSNDLPHRMVVLLMQLGQSSVKSSVVFSSPAADYASTKTGGVMLISKHDKSHILELEDGSTWRIWPGDIGTTLRWLPTTELRVAATDHEFYSHVLIDQSDGSRVGVIPADADWPTKQVQQHLKKG
jgi:hypothetical protein